MPQQASCLSVFHHILLVHLPVEDHISYCIFFLPCLIFPPWRLSCPDDIIGLIIIFGAFATFLLIFTRAHRYAFNHGSLRRCLRLANNRDGYCPAERYAQCHYLPKMSCAKHDAIWFWCWAWLFVQMAHARNKPSPVLSYSSHIPIFSPLFSISYWFFFFMAAPFFII